jgi:poly-gamma-glutamate capsule biosynthesis protein CapA/YwtB (metallophosphatase superfamily)
MKIHISHLSADPVGVQALLSACLLVLLAGAPASAFSQARAALPQTSSPAPLKCDIADGFTLAAVGDVIMANPESTNANPAFQAQLKILRGADVAFGNFESTAIDIRDFRGAPQAENGGQWLVSSPSVPADLKEMGFSMMNRANNHSTDWGVLGMEQTDHLLDKAGIVHAGTGRDMADARAPQYLETPEGRVALVGISATFPPMSVAANPAGIVPGRAGVDVLHTTPWILVTPAVMRDLVQVANSLPGPPSRKALSGTPERLVLPLGFGQRAQFQLSDHKGVHYEMDPEDEAAILRNIREGKESANLLIATIHCHQAGMQLDQPPDFLVKFAHEAIDNGADAFIGHGPHVLRGIEIYKGKPIFYSLGNYFFEMYQQQTVPPPLFSAFRLDPNSTTQSELEHIRTSREFGKEPFWTSVIAVTTYSGGQVSEIRLYPVDMGQDRPWNERGVPRLASADVARSVLQRLANLSKPFGTTIRIEGSVGIIRLAPAR